MAIFLLSGLSMYLRRPVLAATTPGLTVSPAQLSFRIKPGAPSQTETVTITNTYGTNIHLSAELRGIDETGVRLVPSDYIDESLADAIKLSATDITVLAKHSYQLTVTVTNTSNLADGGHYASLILTQHATTANSSFQPAVALSLFIIKDQNIRTNLQLSGFEIDHSLIAFPSRAILNFKNLGNTHVIPRASVSIYDGESLVGKGIANTTSQVLLPNQQAAFSVEIESYHKLLLPRKLRASIVYRIEGMDVQLIKEQTFWYVPLIDVLALCLLVALGWVSRRAIGKIFRKMFGHKKDKRQRSVRATTKRILGRTVIRTHQVTSKVTERSRAITTAHQPKKLAGANPRQKHITVEVIEDSSPHSKKTTPTAPKSTTLKKIKVTAQMTTKKTVSKPRTKVESKKKTSHPKRARSVKNKQ